MKIGIEANVLKRVLSDVYYITGTAYAGKSTMVKLLAEQFDGIMCGENYHDALMRTIDAEHQPNLSYFSTMRDWQEFIGRTPDEYDAWIQGCSREAAELELIMLIRLAAKGKKIFVDTNIPLEILNEISDHEHVAIMLSPQSMSVEQFFNRDDDADKKFILRQIQAASDPDKAMKNYRACIARVNSKEHFDEYANSGFYTFLRDGSLGIEETLEVIAGHFGLM